MKKGFSIKQLDETINGTKFRVARTARTEKLASI